MAARRASQPDLPRMVPPAAEPFLARVIAGPILFISFLVSLALIDRQTSQKILGKEFNKDGYYHSHQRKLGKQEMNDAFQARPKVIAIFCLASGVILAVTAFAVSKLWHLLWYRSG
jgi:hypothetical protein